MPHPKHDERRGGVVAGNVLYYGDTLTASLKKRMADAAKAGKDW